MALGKNVKKYRIAAELTQTQLADAAGMDQQALAALERRDSSSSKFTTALAAALGKSVDDLLGNNEGNDSVRTIPDNYVDATEITKLIAYYVQSTKKGRMQIMEASELSEKLNSRARGKASND